MRRREQPAVSVLTDAQQARLRALWALLQADNSPALRHAMGEFIVSFEGAAPPGVLSLYRYRLEKTHQIGFLGEVVAQFLGEQR